MCGIKTRVETSEKQRIVSIAVQSSYTTYRHGPFATSRDKTLTLTDFLIRFTTSLIKSTNELLLREVSGRDGMTTTVGASVAERHRDSVFSYKNFL